MAVNQLNEFYFDEYVLEKQKNDWVKDDHIVVSLSANEGFYTLCENVKKHFESDWEAEQGRSVNSTEKLLENQKKAIIGYEQEVNFFKDKIQDYLSKNKLLNSWYPSWYTDIVSAIFHENWGLAGISEWKEKYKESTSAKIVGERIYFLIDGKMVGQEQTISKNRLGQLKKALLLRTPEKRMDLGYAEVYMLDGTRITIFDEGLAKEPVIVFRNYIVKNFTFEEQAKRSSIPKECIPMLKAKVKIGYNVCFVGPVRSGKTTFLQTWQSYEDPSLEGIQIETDPEIPLHELMPNAPIIQLVADGVRLQGIIKSIMRSDADYIVVAEARDGIALNIAVKAANKGTRRVKSTFHTSMPEDFCYDAANEIVADCGGNLFATIIKIAKSYHYLYEFIQLQDKSKKRLKGIYEIRYNNQNNEVTIHRICKYKFKTDDWTFKYDIGEDKRELGYEEDLQALKDFEKELMQLAESFPMQENHIINCSYNHLIGK